MESQIPVLIVGAGPTGLMMACELARHGISFRIIDKNLEPTKGSYATWIQPRTLEILELIGMADRFVRAGNKCNVINLYADNKQAISLSLDKLQSAYPFLLMLAQSQTEKLLNQRLEELKHKVERSLELIDVKQKNHQVIATIKHPDGHSETITSHWLIACDGANSMVRNECKIRFAGKDVPEQFMVADAKMHSFTPKNEVNLYFAKGTVFPERGMILTAFPLGSDNYRVTANLYQGSIRQSFTEQEVKEALSERAPGNYTIDSISWISPFWIHCKSIDKMRDGAIFFAGDAANTHSPAAGQGMNTGIQDAFNLAWKLALVIKDKALPALLDSYNLERHPLINKVINDTEHYTTMALFDQSFTSQVSKFGKKLSAETENDIASRLTQLGIRYEDSSIIDYNEKVSAKSPRSGMRALDVVLSSGKKLSSYLNQPLHTVLLFTGTAAKQNTLEKISQLQSWINSHASGLVKMYIVSHTPIDGDNVILDSDEQIHAAYHVKTAAVFIVRPDNYIAYESKELEIKNVEQFFKRYLLLV